MIYLDNAATSYPKAPGVPEAAAEGLTRPLGNPGRAAHGPAVDAERLVTETRTRLARFINAPAAERVVFTANATDAINTALFGLLDRSDHPARVVTTGFEHNAVNRPLRALRDSGRVTVEHLQTDGLGLIDPDDLAGALAEPTALVVIAHASNVTGALRDIASVGEHCRQRGALLCVDAAQTAGVTPIDVRAMGVDLLAVSCHKGLLAATGLGALYVGPRCDGRLRPRREGGSGGESDLPRQPDQLPQRFEAGTHNLVGIATLAAALDYMEPRSPDEGLAHERRLLGQLRASLSDVPGVVWYGPAEPSVGVLSLNIQGQDPQAVAVTLEAGFAVAVRAGLHCAPGAHRRLGTFPAGTVRVSPGRFNTPADIDALAGALRALACS